MRRLLLTAVLAVIAGCATSYAPKSFWNDGGFTETEVQPGIYQVRFVGNEYTSNERAADFAMLRAAELCLERSSPYIVIGDMNTVSKATAVVPGTATTNASVYGTGNAAYGTATTTVTPATTLYSPESGLTMACSGSQVDGAWDASFLANAMKSKYNIE